MVVVVFYALLPIPTMIARRNQNQYGGSGQPCMDLAIFLSMGVIVSSFALPIIFSRVPDKPVVSMRDEFNSSTSHWGRIYPIKHMIQP